MGAWEHRFEWSESQGEAGRLIDRLDRDGWEIVSCWGPAGGEVNLLVRRPRRAIESSALPNIYSGGDIVCDVD